MLLFGGNHGMVWSVSTDSFIKKEKVSQVAEFQLHAIIITSVMVEEDRDICWH